MFVRTLMSVGMLWVPVSLAETFTLDLTKSKIQWHGRSVAMYQHDGLVPIKSGMVEIDKGQFKVGEAVLEVSKLTNTDITDSEKKQKLEDHLKSQDFFEIDKYPTAIFRMSKLEALKEKTPTANYTLSGKLTIKDVTKDITVPVLVTIEAQQATLKASLPFDRTEWNVKYNSKKFFDINTLKDKIIEDIVTLDVDLVAKK